MTAVEWLVNHLQKSKDWQRVLNEVSQMSSAKINLLEQAKEMEREQLYNFYMQGGIDAITEADRNEYINKSRKQQRGRLISDGEIRKVREELKKYERIKKIYKISSIFLFVTLLVEIIIWMYLLTNGIFNL